MVGLMGGFLSNPLWRAVGGDTTTTNGRDSPIRGQPMGGLNTPRPYFTNFPGVPVRNLNQHYHSVPPTSCQKRCEHVKKKDQIAAGMRSPDDDWVMFDLNSASITEEKHCDRTPCLSLTSRSTLLRNRPENPHQPFESVARSITATQTTTDSSSNVATSKVSRYATSNMTGSFSNISASKVNSSCNGSNLIIFDESHFSSEFKVPHISSSDNEDTLIDMHMNTAIEIKNISENIPNDQLKVSSNNIDSTEWPFNKKHSWLPCNRIDNKTSPAIPGNCCRSQYQEVWPSQCVPDHCSSCLSNQSSKGRYCHAFAVASPSNIVEKEIGSVTVSSSDTSKDNVKMETPPLIDRLSEMDKNRLKTVTKKNQSDNSGTGKSQVLLHATRFQGSDMQKTSVGYREDIRAYDIYQITPQVSTEARYSRLPTALPALTDSDSDPDDVCQKGVRKRKRKMPSTKRGQIPVEGGKKSREIGDHGPSEARRRSSTSLDDVTVYTSPYLEDYTNRISNLGMSPEQDLQIPNQKTFLGGNLQRRSHSSLDAGSLHQKSRGISSSPSYFSFQGSPLTSDLSTHTPFPPSSNSSVLTQHEGDDYGDIVMHVDEDDDDEDEASTVVPDDFDDETDSDIEVLRQSESWVDLSNQPEETPDRVTPLPFGNGEEYIRLLREAQKESNHSSARVSLASSRRDTPRDSPHDSPKSPPNSPNTELTTDPEETVLKGVYINYFNKEGDFIRVEQKSETDWIWDWSSRPDQNPPKEWKFSHPGKGVNRGASIRRVMVGKSKLFSRDVLYTLLITNVLSLLIGTGIGIWLSKRSSSGTIMTLPIN